MRRLVWDVDARRDFREITAFLVDRDADVASLVRQRIRDAVIRLARYPTGRPSRFMGFFEKRAEGTPYIIAYTLGDTVITITRIIHQRRDWPMDDWPADDWPQP